MSSKPVLAIITRDGCIHCKHFKQDNEALVLEMLNRRNFVDVVRINNGQPDKKMNKNTMKYVSFVPTFMLVTRDSWDKDEEIEGAIMNQTIGHYEGDKFIPTAEGKTEFLNTSSQIEKWIDRELKKNPLFNKTIPQKIVIDSAYPYRVSELPDPVSNNAKTKSHPNYDSDSDDFFV